MNLKLEKELKETNSGPWYRVTVDDKYINGSFNLEEMQKLFDKIKANPELLKSGKEILLSEEI